MKPNTPRLPRFLHGVFLLIEVLIILFTVLLVGLVLFNGRPLFSEREKGNGIHTTINIGEISLSIPKEQYELSIREHPSEGTQIEDLRGYIKTSNPQVAREYLRAIRPALTMSLLFWGAAAVAICELFRRVFKQVGRGESFTPSNVKNFHKIGVTILVATLGIALLGGWAQYSVANFIADHVEAEGLVVHAQPLAPDGGVSFTMGNFLFHFDLGWLLAGLMILALGEAFRQGLKLKEESELTI